MLCSLKELQIGDDDDGNIGADASNTTNTTTENNDGIRKGCSHCRVDSSKEGFEADKQNDQENVGSSNFDEHLNNKL